MSCNGNCKCKSETKIETVWVESEIGEQLMFAVPENGVNEPEANYLNLFYDEVIWLLDKKIESAESSYHYYYKNGGTNAHMELLQVNLDAIESVKYEIEKIFEKYR